MATPATALAGDGTFRAPTTAGAGLAPDSVALGDFNNDGNEDLAVANGGGDASIDLGNGSGGFAAPTTASASGPVSLAVGDFNGDGNDDLAMANYFDNNVGIDLGDGSGGFAAPTTAGAGTGPKSVAVGDFNGDGNDDLAVANYAANNVSIDVGNGSGGFAAPTTAGAGTQPVSVAAGDFNSDGKEDLAVANAATGGVSIDLGNGSGGFAAPTAAGAGTSPASVAVGDFNGDGKEDLAVPDQYGGVSIDLGNGSGGFAAPTTAGAGSDPFSVAVGDFNSDGNEDLAVTNASGNVSIDVGAGSGGFAAPTTAGAGSTPFSVAVGDFNNDGNEDLAVANSGVTSSGIVSIDLGNGAAPLAGNLLKDGGFEGASAVRNPTDSSPPAIPGWQRTGKMTAARYGMRYSSIFPSLIASPRYLTGGLNYLFGGPGPGPGDTTAFQNVDVSESAHSIDAGLATAHLSAYLGGGSVYDDRMSATAAFLGATGNPLGSFTIGPVTVTDRKKLSTLLPRSGAAAVPTGTRQIRVALTASNSDAGGSSAFADNVKLTLSGVDRPPVLEPIGDKSISEGGQIQFSISGSDPDSYPSPLSYSATHLPPGATFNPSTRTFNWNVAAHQAGTYRRVHFAVSDGAESDSEDVTITVADRTPPQTRKLKGPKKRIHGRKAKFKFASERGAKFKCRLDRKRFKRCTSPRKVKHLKPGRHTFQAEAIDRAGNADPTPAKWRFRVIRRPA